MDANSSNAKAELATAKLRDHGLTLFFQPYKKTWPGLKIAHEAFIWL